MINKQILNIFAKISAIHKHSKMNFAYEPEVSLFDKVISDFDDINLINKEISALPGIPTNGIIINNPVDFAQKMQSYASFASVTNFLLYHFLPPPFFKKEDIDILSGNVSSCRKISFINDNKAWLIPDMNYIDYGVPGDIISNILGKYKQKDILVLNFNNNNQSDIVYKQLETAYPALSVDSLKEYSLDLKNIIDIISEYKVVVDINSTYNQLISLCCGCIVVSGNHSLQNKQLVNVSHSKEIVQAIPALLNTYNQDTLQKNAEELLVKYDLNKFQANLLQILVN